MTYPGAANKKCAMVFAAMLMIDNAISAAEPVAHIMGRQIDMEEISPPSGEVLKQQSKLSAEKFAKWLGDYRNDRLGAMIWKPLMEEFCKGRDCKATPKEIDELEKATDKNMEESEREWRQSLPQVEQKLESPSLSQDERTVLIERKRVIESLLASRKQEKKEEHSPEALEAARSVSKQFVEKWKFNRALYRKYGGRIIFQQAGIEPLDAYRQFLEEHEKNGSFAILDSSLRAKFWEYFTTMSHTFLEPGEANFDAPWWKKEKSSD